MKLVALASFEGTSLVVQSSFNSFVCGSKHKSLLSIFYSSFTMKTFTLSTVAALAAMANAAPQFWERSTSALDVSLTANGNTEVTAVITNTGATDLNLLTAGSILDASPVEKVSLFSAGTSSDIFSR